MASRRRFIPVDRIPHHTKLLLMPLVMSLALIGGAIPVIALGAPESESDLRGFLDGTLWEQYSAGYPFDPYLLYSVSLMESRKTSKEINGYLQPWPYAINIDGEGYFPETFSRAKSLLNKAISDPGVANIDAGIMQVSIKWHGHRVNNPADLLVPGIAISVGAEILDEAIRSAPGDMELGVGRYHHWEDESVSRLYGRQILAIYEAIRPDEPHEVWNDR